MRKFNINVNGQNYVVDVEEIGGSAQATAPVVAAAPVAAAPKAAAPVGKGSPCNAPMPGLIKALKVANGASVKKGQAVLVLEAMKMENDIAAHADGIVSFAVASGDTVDSNVVLFTIA